MNHYFEPVNLLQWNMFQKVQAPGHIETFLATKSMALGDILTLYVGKQDPRVEAGIYALGEIIRGPYLLEDSPDDYCNNKNSVDVRIDRIQYEKPIVPGKECKRIFRQFRTVHKIGDEGLPHLLEYLARDEICWPEEIVEAGGVYYEGSKHTITVNAYERNPEARKKCIAEYGAKCQICGIDFGKEYGDEFAGKIHVHHIKPLFEVDSHYCVDPIKDLIPVCPNCHMILHSKPNGTYTPDEVRQMRKKNEYIEIGGAARR